MSSQEELKYQKKYLKYKNKFLSLRNKNLALEEYNSMELQNGGSGFANVFKSVAKKGSTVAKSAAKSGYSVAKSVASNPAVQAAALNAATVAAQDPAVQAKLAQAQQYYANSPNAQLAAQVAMSHPKVQSAMYHPVTQQAINIAKTSTSTPQLTSISTPISRSPDSVWNTLSVEQKQKLINLLPSI